MPRKRSRARKTTRKSRKDLAAEGRAFEAQSRMRRDKKLSLKRAARLAHTTPKTVLKYLGSEFRKTSSGRYVVTPSDRLTRRMWLPTKSGKVEVAVRGSGKRSEVGRYWNAVDWYSSTGDDSRVVEFQGKGIHSKGSFFPFLTDTAVLDRLVYAEETSFESVYSTRA